MTATEAGDGHASSVSVAHSSLFAATDDQAVFSAPSLAYLKYTAWSILLAAAGVLLTILLIIPDQPWRAGGPAVMLVIAALALHMLSLGRLRAALTLIVWGSWLAVAGISLFFGGVHGLLTITYPLLVITAGWLFGTRC